MSTSAQAELQDPTRPPAALYSEAPTATGESKGMFLSSILISPQRRVAVINGKVLQLGDQLGDARVVKIKPSGVVLRHGSDEQIISLLPNTLKMRSGKKGK